jgi:methyltransferase (TIGR00027 family)
MPESPAIENISDTALWVAMYRALETDRPDAHFRDPYARRLAGERGQQILERLPMGRAMAWPMVVRTAVFDEIILRLAGDPGLDLVLDLAAGLDARPWRMPLAPHLRWADLDLPGILDHKTRLLAAEPTRCRYQAVAVDLRDPSARRDAFAQQMEGASRALAMTEGLLIYLEAEQVAALASDLHAAGIRWWLMDIASPALLEMLKRRMGSRLAEGGAPFRFAPAESTRFFEPYGWKEVEFRSTWQEAKRLKREMSTAWFWRILERFASERRREAWRRFAGIALLERK